MSKFSIRSTAAFAALCIVAPTMGQSLGAGNYRKYKKKPEKVSAFYGAFTPNIALRNIQNIDFSSNNGTNPMEIVASNAFGLGVGLNPEFGWYNIVRFKGRSLASGTRSVNGRWMNKVLFFDADGAVTFFAPVNQRVNFLIIGGWDYKLMRFTYRVQGVNTSYTGAKTSANGPFGGVGFSLCPKEAWTVEGAVTYHAPTGEARMRTRDANDMPGPTGAWLNKIKYRGARFGLGGYLNANWKVDSHWSIDLSLEGLSLTARGENQDTVKATNSDYHLDTMNIAYVNYGFGLNYRF